MHPERLHQPAEPDSVVVALPTGLPGGGPSRTSGRRLGAGDQERFEGYLGEILTALGLDLATPGTSATPRRFLRALHDATVGYEGDDNLVTAFPTEHRGGPAARAGQVVEGPIRFYALCEHHALPFHGTAHVGYVPGEQIIGISKLTRLVQVFARRFTVQERLGEQVADTLTELLAPRGVAVRLEAEHLCTQMRGVREEHSRTVTTSWRGAFAGAADLRGEFLHEATGRRGGGWR
jgi:GTP cyclohydrolase I